MVFRKREEIETIKEEDLKEIKEEVREGEVRKEGEEIYMKTYLIEISDGEEYIDTVIVFAENVMKAVQKFVIKYEADCKELTSLSFDVSETEVLQ